MEFTNWCTVTHTNSFTKTYQTTDFEQSNEMWSDTKATLLKTLGIDFPQNKEMGSLQMTRVTLTAKNCSEMGLKKKERKRRENTEVSVVLGWMAG